MVDNQLSRYGAITRTIPYLAPGAKVFLVCDSDDTTNGPANIGNEFPVDRDGVVRVYTTIQDAANAASSGRGDVILVMPGYDHSLARADTWATSNLHIVGLGQGMSKPILRYTVKTDAVNVNANNVLIENIRFLADADSIALAVDLDSSYSGHTIRKCVFDYDSNQRDFRVMIKAGSARSVIEDNEFWAEDTAGAGHGVFILGGYPDFLKIRNNFFYGQFDTVGDTSGNHGGAISCDSGYDSGDTTLSGLEIANNTIVSTDTAAACMINLGGAGVSIRGIVRDNRICGYDTAGADSDYTVLGDVAAYGAMPINNHTITGDSDVWQALGGRTRTALVKDSG